MSPMTQAALRDALAAGAGRMPFHEAALLLLNRLGFRSDRTLPGQTGRVADLPDAFSVNQRGTRTANAFKDEAMSVHVLFQLGDQEIRDAAQPHLQDGAGRFDGGVTKSFLFVAVELRGTGSSYSRTRYSQFAREVNQGLAMPAFVLFRELDTRRLTLAFVDRRPHKRDDKREVLSRVSLIRSIDPGEPHRAHLDILSDLSLGALLGWMESRRKSRDFDGLRAAVLDALDTQALNKRFYRELFAWFERAVDEATFPADPNRKIGPEHHVIRLITRLMFIWFIKEKELVAPELFIEGEVGRLLKDYDSREGDSWYRAVLQNLFFATLNTELGRRRFSSRSRRTHRVHSLYRYRDLMADREELVKLFRKTPFINGGLFECLDSSDRTQSTGGWRIDCFTDCADHRAKLSVPNRLFFDTKGLIPLFERYRFTVEENTPIEKEVALDPELLGSVFENLLAAVNPETRETARKESGSFYTPRPIVDYMVRETLLLSLLDSTAPDDGDADWWRDRLLYLLDTADAFDDAEELFEQGERKRIVRAVADLTVLDPAVGSGAFLLSMLHTLTLVLRRLDPKNELWVAEQRRRAGDRARNTFLQPGNSRARKEELAGIDETFRTYRDSDFGRKLYLIQNCLHGVDIQPVACLIAKLRFFISLAIEQETSPDEANYGIRPLPNLETRILAADTLTSLTSQQVEIGTDVGPVNATAASLRHNRERHFHATTRDEKLALRDQDHALRRRLRDALRRAGFAPKDSTKVADWNPYDQNASAPWFDTAYMFGKSGFDIVLGNPPYRQLQKDGGALAKKYKDAGFDSFAATGDIYQLFIEKGMDLLEGVTGTLAYVTSNSWQKALYGRKTRKLLDGHSPLRLVNLGPGVFENAVVDTCVLVARRGPGDEDCRTAELRPGDEFPPAENDWTLLRRVERGPWCVLSKAEWSLMEKIEAAGKPLREWPGVSINYGIKTGLNSAFIIGNETKEALIREDPRSAGLLKPLVRGRDVGAYTIVQSDRWLIAAHNGYDSVPRVDVTRYPAILRHLNAFMPALARRHDQGDTPFNLRSCAYYEIFRRPKLMWGELSNHARFAVDRRGMYCNNTVFLLTERVPELPSTSLYWLCAVLNSPIAERWIAWTARTSGLGVTRWEKGYVESLPVPRNSSAEAACRGLIERRDGRENPATPKDVRKDLNAIVIGEYDLTVTEGRLLGMSDPQ